MPNQEQVKMLAQGVKEWNAWRKANIEVEVDLSGADLSGARGLTQNQINTVRVCDESTRLPPRLECPKGKGDESEP